MSHAETIRAYVKANPWKTAREISEVLGINRGTVSYNTTTEVKKGYFVQRVAGKTISNVRFHMFAYPDAPPPAGTKNEVVLPANVPLAPANVPLKQEVKLRKKAAETHLSSFDAIIDTLASTLAHQIAESVRTKLVQELSVVSMSRAAPQIGVIHPPEPLVEQARKRRFLICGLLPQQAGMLQTEFNEVFDLRFWKDETPGKLKSMIPGCERVLVATGKISHATCDIIKTTNTPIEYCQGGMSSLRDRLTKLYVEE